VSVPRDNGATDGGVTDASAHGSGGERCGVLLGALLAKPAAMRERITESYDKEG